MSVSKSQGAKAVEAFIGIGSNEGQREWNVARAVEALSDSVEVLSVSSMYETEPMYLENQPWFVNCVARVRTVMSPRELLGVVKEVEESMGRRRGKRFGPRVIDLDILLYGDQVISDEGLEIPHPKLQERAFVLAPLVEIAPEVVHPLSGESASEMLRKLHTVKVVRRLSDRAKN